MRMQQSNQWRTVGTLVMIILVVMVNALCAFVFELYPEWVAWCTYALAALVMFVVLRYQQRLTTTLTAALMALPFVVSLLAVLINN